MLGDNLMDEEVFQQYAKAWRKRQRDEERKRRKKLRQAREAAGKLAEILVQNYGAKEVWLFGSLIRSGSFHRNSDIDLAAAGLPAQEFFRILARLNESIISPTPLDRKGKCSYNHSNTGVRDGRTKGR
ncbi:DNA polymerase beta domain protein region [Desulfofundulus kuznetsovii DSM 6115]|uniref:DNA polymerase beta domain protein region n=1 Tax=Desulfofundulus kuznetsovii (strain DSM 6115 / VKM B-1805 / 17) TaxID=760568 RepID=A0AAU8PQK5_DESK7|nr:DNA polymerase beta domain protein region [Desulfofundulus kuznetsovii DSM 6115]